MILRNITIQDICKANFKNRSLEIKTILVVRSNIEKTIISKCRKEKKQMQCEMCKTKNDNTIEINDDLHNATNNDNVIHYSMKNFN
jgi:hypothetical protein